jgi:hypothetical protein
MQSLLAPPVTTAVPSRSELDRLPTGVAALKGIRELETLLDRFVASWHSSPPLMESRSHHRVRYDKPLVLTPMDPHSHGPAGEPRLVQGRDISLGGCSFCHIDPLPCGRVALTFGLEDERPVTFMLRLTWCRFTQDGLYQSGGKFLKPVDLPNGPGTEWRTLPSG